MDRLRLIVVEDDPVNARLLTAILGHEGYDSTLVSSGRQFLDRVQAERFDLAIVDLRLPDLSGSECIRILRQELGLDLPVLVVSAAAMPDDRQEALASGATSFLAKPFSAAELIGRIPSLLNPVARQNPDR